MASKKPKSAVPSTPSPRSSATSSDGGGRSTQGEHPSQDERHRMIAEAAYYIAASRGFNGGDPVADWLAAESLISGSTFSRKQ